MGGTSSLPQIKKQQHKQHKQVNAKRERQSSLDIIQSTETYCITTTQHRHQQHQQKHPNTSQKMDNQHRSRLLYSLGFQEPSLSQYHREKETNKMVIVSRCGGGISRGNVDILSAEKPIRRSLNDSKNNQWNQLVDRINILGNRGRRIRAERRRTRTPVVQFNNDVMVKQIASHKVYSNRIKNTMWNDSQTIQENATRNQIEYEAEDRKWEAVIEDDEMYVNAKTGELVHPVWVESCM